MNFQFYCPQGHLLQSDTANAGYTIACPICGTQFIVPAPPQSLLDAAKQEAQTENDEDDEDEDEAEEDLFAFRGKGKGKGKGKSSGATTNLNELLAAQDDDDDEDEEEDDEDEDGDDEDEDEDDEAEEGGNGGIFSFDPSNDRRSDLPPLHIPCPKGHVLEVPREILGEEVECPYCGEQFLLKRERSFEYINDRYKQETSSEAKVSKEWFTRAMIGVILAIALILFLLLAK